MLKFCGDCFHIYLLYDMRWIELEIYLGGYALDHNHLKGQVLSNCQAVRFLSMDSSVLHPSSTPTPAPSYFLLALSFAITDTRGWSPFPSPSPQD